MASLYRRLNSFIHFECPWLIIHHTTLMLRHAKHHLYTRGPPQHIRIWLDTQVLSHVQQGCTTSSLWHIKAFTSTCEDEPLHIRISHYWVQLKNLLQVSWVPLKKPTSTHESQSRLHKIVLENGSLWCIFNRFELQHFLLWKT